MVISELIIRENYLCSQADRVFRGDYLATKKQKEKWDTICRTLYHEYNRIYFGGSLPKNIKFKFRKMRNWGGFCAAHENTITLNSYYFTDYFDEDERGHFTTDYAIMWLYKHRGALLRSHIGF